MNLEIKAIRIVADIEVEGKPYTIEVTMGIGSPLGEELVPHIQEEVAELAKEGHFSR